MKYALFFSLLFIGCGSTLQGPPGPQGSPGPSPSPSPSPSPCSVKKVDSVSTITCPDGTSSEVSDGIRGPQGVSGNDGNKGSSVVFNIVPAAQCVNGGNYILMAEDINNNGVLDAGDSNMQSALVCNGLNGVSPPTQPFSVVSPIMPCGQASSPFKEVLLCLGGGQLLASFSETAGGLNTRFAIIPAGTYEDTDSSGCVFSVSVDGSGSSTVSWSAGHSAYSTWLAGTAQCSHN